MIEEARLMATSPPTDRPYSQPCLGASFIVFMCASLVAFVAPCSVPDENFLLQKRQMRPTSSSSAEPGSPGLNPATAT